MRFDVFHSVGRIDSISPRLADKDVFQAFFTQAKLADDLGFGTMWVAESHFSSEVQKQNPQPVIPHYQGEVGLNCDSPQLAQRLFALTQKIGFGTAIYNVVGGNGGPIGAADRIRSLAFLNSLAPEPRRLDIGIASGRFPYINRPFGIVPRSDEEAKNWPQYGRLILAEAIEIFLRLSHGEVLSADDVQVTRCHLPDTDVPYRRRWDFERLKLVPALDMTDSQKWLRFVLGSTDPITRDTAWRWADCDIFNLSFTPPEQINKMHAEMFTKAKENGRLWHRSRMPRTVMVFIDASAQKAQDMASRCFDTYIEAMRGTAQVPDKEKLMARALIGDPTHIKEQLLPLAKGGSGAFDTDDRLMLWFEFNQARSDEIMQQMRLFADKVMPHFL